MAKLDRYSRTVAFLKVLFPLAALGLLSTLFLLSSNDDPVATIPFAENEVSERVRGQQVTAPYFSGTTANGDEISVTASIARPGDQDRPGDAQDLTARVKFADGARMSLKSRYGTLNLPDDTVVFSGDVIIRTSTGMVLETDILNTVLSGIRADAPGEVRATGPMGELTAGQMQIDSKTEGGPVHILFKSGVKLIYDPKQSER